MWEILKEIRELQFKERGCMPHLRGASLVGQDVGGHSYAARTVSRSRLNQRCHNRNELSRGGGGGGGGGGRAGCEFALGDGSPTCVRGCK